MGWGGKKGSGGGDVVLESRHVIGLFLLLVVISGVFYTLGYVMGRSQYDSQVRAANKNKNKEGAPPELPASAAKQPTTTPSVVPPPSDWDFYRAAEPVRSAASREKPDKPDKPVKPVDLAGRASSPKPVSPEPAKSQSKSLLNAPLIPRGAVVLQVAAVKRESDALALAGLLQEKKFPAFVLTPGADPYYRVQVGPYADVQSANAAKRGLENEGFKSIVKH